MVHFLADLNRGRGTLAWENGRCWVWQRAGGWSKAHLHAWDPRVVPPIPTAGDFLSVLLASSVTFVSPLGKKSPGIHHPQFLSLLRDALVFFFGSAMKLVRVLFPHQGLNPVLAVKAPSPNHWTTREFPRSALKSLFIGCVFHNQHRGTEAQSEPWPWSKRSGLMPQFSTEPCV